MGVKELGRNKIKTGERKVGKIKVLEIRSAVLCS